MKEAILQKFTELYGGEPLIVRSPGRINLIGEHTDYNMGFVLPAAIDKAIYFAVSPREDDEIHLYALDLNQHFKGNVQTLIKSGQGWPDYILGGLQQLEKRGLSFKGFNAVLGGDVPLGAGLSSSAAVECASLMAFNQLFDLGLTRLEIVQLAQKAENEFVGVKCGIMDQFASAFGKKDQVIQLDCRSLEYEYFPFVLEDYSIVLFDSNVKHSLASSEYNLRREQCEAGVALIQKHHPEVQSLRDATVEMVMNHVRPVNELVYRRCSFVVYEIERLQQACLDLKAGNLLAFGQKMFHTHYGLSRDYEVSCPELDFLVQEVHENPAVIGARMMGGGFGGCTINLIRKDSLDATAAAVEAAYRDKLGLELKVYKVSIENGTEIIHQPAQNTQTKTFA